MPIISPDDTDSAIPDPKADLQPAALVLNGLDLMMVDPAGDGYLIEVLGDDFKPGDPEAVYAAIQSQLQDGDIERIDRSGNREATIPLRIKAPGHPLPGQAIAAGQLALELACRFEGFAALEYTSPLSGAEVSVTEMANAVVAKSFDDLSEVTQRVRYFTVTIHARPFVRPVTTETFEAPAVIGGVTTTVDDGSSATGWSLLAAAPATTTNIEADPTVTGVGGWIAGGGTTSLSYDGGLLATSAIDSSGEAKGYVNGAYTVTAGRAYQFGVNITAIDNWGSDAVALGSQFGMMLRWYSSSGQIGGDVVTAISSIWQNQSSDVATSILTAPSGATQARLFPFIQRSPYRATRWRINARWANECVSAADLRAGYFDGSTSDTVAVNYAWTGSTGSSTSTATWTAASLTSTGGKVQGTVYGRSAAPVRRAAAISMAELNYIRVRGTALWDTASPKFNGLAVSLSDNGGAALARVSYTLDTAGNFDIIVKRPEGFTNLDVKATASDSTAPIKGIRVSVDSVVITDNPFGGGKVQVRQIQIEGSQRTELSLSVLGLDNAGTTPVALGDQVLIHTASVFDDQRAKFVACRSASGASGTGDVTAVSGAYNVLGPVASPTTFALKAADLLPGSWLIVPRFQPKTTGDKTISFAATVTSGATAISDPLTGWNTCPLTVGATWPAIPQDNWRMVPIGVLRLPPADVEDPAANVVIKFAASASSAVWVDEVFLVHATTGELTLLNLASGVSSVRLDAASTERAQPSAWVGTANGAMVQVLDQDFAQHQAVPQILSVVSVTPGCDTTRLSGHYFAHYDHDVAPRNLRMKAALDTTGA